MLPQPSLITPIPELTVSVAQAAFPKGNTFILMRDEAVLSSQIGILLNSSPTEVNLAYLRGD